MERYRNEVGAINEVCDTQIKSINLGAKSENGFLREKRET